MQLKSYLRVVTDEFFFKCCLTFSRKSDFASLLDPLEGDGHPALLNTRNFARR